MKKRSLILGLAVFVCSALIFNGCEQDSNDDGGGDTFTDVTGDYSLKTSEAASADDDESGLVIASALKSNSTGDVTIILAGKVKPAYQFSAVADDKTPSTITVTQGTSLGTPWTETWGDTTALAGAEPGVYGAAYISGIITQSIVDAGTLAIRQTNQALRVYSGKSDTYAKAVPEAPVVPPNPHNGFVPDALWVPAVGAEGVPVRWKAYVDGTTKVPNQKVEPFGILIWNGGTALNNPNKTATIEVKKAAVTVGTDGKATATASDLLARYIIDYSGVTFPTPNEVASDLAEALGGTGKAAASGTTVTVTGTTVSVPEDKTVTVPAGVTLTVAAGATLTNNGTISLDAGAELVLAAASTSSVGKIAGTGTISAGKTVITGAWEVVGGTSPGTLTITSAAAGATITADGTNATGLKASAAGAVITQGAGASNALTVGAATTIDLGGDGTTAAGKLVLTGAAADPGKLVLSTATTSIVKTGNTAGTGAFTTAAKIGGKTFGTSSADITTTVNTAAGKFATLTATNANEDLVGGADADNTITIDSTQEVAASS